MKTQQTTFHKIDYHRLSKQEQLAVREAFFPIAKASFPTLTQEAFGNYIFNEKIKDSSYFAIKSNKQTMGFLYMYCEAIRLDNRLVNLFNTRLVIHPHFQGKSIFIKAMLTQFKVYGLLALKKGGYWISNSINPISYHAIASNCWQLYPSFTHPLTDELRQLLYKLSELDHSQLVPSISSLKYQTTLPCKLTQEQIDRIYKSNKPHIQYFLKEGIDFTKGEGIPLIFPLTLQNLLFSFLKTVRKRYKI